MPPSAFFEVVDELADRLVASVRSPPITITITITKTYDAQGKGKGKGCLGVSAEYDCFFFFLECLVFLLVPFVFGL
jgi:hypothetical protein